MIISTHHLATAHQDSLISQVEKGFDFGRDVSLGAFGLMAIVVLMTLLFRK